MDTGNIPGRKGLLARLRVRKKLIVLHTIFSLVLATILLIALRPAVRHVVREAERFVARGVIGAGAWEIPSTRDTGIRTGTPEALGLEPWIVERALARPGEPVARATDDGRTTLVAYDASRDAFVSVGVRIPGARTAVLRLYLLMVGALLGVYALVALALEAFVLPEHVYRPIRRLLEADLAARDGRRGEEIIPAEEIPADELGEIMSSRNETIGKLRSQERALGDALVRLEEVAMDLKRKNFLLETARRNLAESDRLASLGLMSAGIAHELNTPLAVLKGLVEKLDREGTVDGPQAALMVRVVGRLERLGESLLDFARVRPPNSRCLALRPLVEEAITLVSLDRDGQRVALRNEVAPGLEVRCDPDRMLQVLVNLVRNACDAVRSRRDARGGGVVVCAERIERDDRSWDSLRVIDDGPGLDPELIPRLFEPFASTRLDSRGTGLGLAVSEGIVREHGGLILAGNRKDGAGAVFEVLLPAGTEAPSAPGGGTP